METGKKVALFVFVCAILGVIIYFVVKHTTSSDDSGGATGGATGGVTGGTTAGTTGGTSGIVPRPQSPRPSPTPSNQKVDCVYSWYPWSECSSLVCGPGYQFRDPIIHVPAKNGGRPCPGNANRANDCSAAGNSSDHCRMCDRGPCTPIDCDYRWNEWSACSKSCGGGTQSRTPTIIRQSGGWGGIPCPTTETRACNTGPCQAGGTSGWVKDSGSMTIASGQFSKIQIELVGGGGGGGHSETSEKKSECGASGGGGGAGGYIMIEKPYSADLPGKELSFTIGQGGSGSTTQESTATVLTFMGQTYTANGGQRGGRAASKKIPGVGGAGGTTSGGTGTNGGNGENGVKGSCGGAGGISFVGAGGENCGFTVDEKNAKSFGAGGSGGNACGRGSTPGDGASGAVRLTYVA